MLLELPQFADQAHIFGISRIARTRSRNHGRKGRQEFCEVGDRVVDLDSCDLDAELCFEEVNDVVSERVIGVDEEHTVGGSVGHSLLSMKEATIVYRAEEGGYHMLVIYMYMICLIYHEYISSGTEDV